MPALVGMFGVCQPRLAPTKTGCAALNDRGGRTNGPHLPVSASGRCQPWLACSGCANQGWHLPKQDVPPSTIEVGGPTVRTYPSPPSGRCQPWLACSVCANQGWHLPKQDVPPSTIKVCGPTVHTCPAPRLVDANLGWHVPGVPTKVGTCQCGIRRPQRSLRVFSFIASRRAVRSTGPRTAMSRVSPGSRSSRLSSTCTSSAPKSIHVART